VVVTVACLASSAGCTAARVDHGRYVSPKGYGVAVPAAGWTIVQQSEADLELRHDSPPANMLANGSCDDERPRASRDVLMRHLLMGLAHRKMIERGEAAIAGHEARHVVVEGRAPGAHDTLRVEAYVVTGERCVYDFLYAAPQASFEMARPDFQRFVESFRVE
jgi:hypothetical protein